MYIKHNVILGKGPHFAFDQIIKPAQSTALVKGYTSWQ